MSKSTIGIVLSLGGFLISVVSLMADYLGLGDVDPDHFVIGSKQIAGIAVGQILLFSGLLVVKSKKK